MKRALTAGCRGPGRTGHPARVSGMSGRARGRSVRRAARLLIPCLGLPLVAASPDRPGNAPWGQQGHTLAARAAVDILPADMPAFFRDATDQLVYLNFEPDRWRERRFVEMDRAGSFDHYIDLENLPPGALDAPDRFTYLDALHAAGLDQPERDGGFLPFRIVELYQRVVTGWEQWRQERDPVRRGWIEDRIINDAGVLGHYVTDASQPHHTTIHFNGWAAGEPNPEGYTTDRVFHSRFETGFVREHVQLADVSRRLPRSPTAVSGSVRRAVTAYILDSHARVGELYRLDRDVGFDPATPAAPAARDFAAERLAAGSTMLADLWWSAWLESASR